MAAPSAESARRAAPLPPDERRHAIVEAVLPLFTEPGELPTSRTLAAAAGVSEGTIFKVFDDKAALFEAVLDRVMDPAAISASIDEIDGDLPFVEQLELAVALMQQRTVGIFQVVSKLHGLVERPHRPSPITDTPALTALIAATDEPLRTSAADAATLLRALTLALSHPMLVDAPRPAAEIVDRFLHGVRTLP